VQKAPEASRLGEPVQDRCKHERDQGEPGEAVGQPEQGDERARNPEAAGEQGDDRQSGVGAGGCGQGGLRHRPRAQPGSRDRQRDDDDGGSALRGRDRGLIG
jgi:hypothetical protein